MPVTLTIEQREAHGNTYTDEVLPPPDGWMWTIHAVWYGTNDCDGGQLRLSRTSRTVHTYQAKIHSLVQWAKEYDIALMNPSTTTPALDGVPTTIISQIFVNPALPFSTSDGSRLFEEYPCPYRESNLCEQVIDNTMAHCSGCQGELRCRECSSILGASNRLIESPQGVTCTNCARACAHHAATGIRCTTLIPRTWRFCSEHGDHFTCDGCEVEFDCYSMIPIAVGDMTYCAACSQLYCGHCGQSAENMTMLDDRFLCSSCFSEATSYRFESENVAALTAEEWLSTNMPDRPIRLVSIEQEFESKSDISLDDSRSNRSYRTARTGNSCGDRLANALYSQGLSPYPELRGYHASGHVYPSHVEADSSVPSGGELVINKLNLGTFADAQNMSKIQLAVQEGIEREDIAFTVKCGTHIHIDLHGYTVPDARNYVTIYSYLEDVIFRLGSSGYSDHRAVISSNRYAAPIPKDKWGDVKKFGVEFLRRADHTDSLNLQHFYNSMQSCKCGAIEFGSMSECSCIRQKCTAEWRVFNGTGNSRRLHAYIAIVQAVTAWSQNRNLNVDDYEVMEFDAGMKFDKQSTFKHLKHADMWKERLTWMFTNLPFTDSERESIIYCIETSPLKNIGEDFIAELRGIERIVEEGRVLPNPVMANRNTVTTAQAGHPFGFNSNGYCNSCGETERYCGCSEIGLAEHYEDDVEPY